MFKDNKSVDDFDWRLQAATTLSIDQHGWKKGDPVIAIGQFKMTNADIWFPLPNMSATFLDFANQCFLDSDGYFVFRNFEKSPKKDYSPINYNEFLKVLQFRIGNVIYSFLALESFMNDSIPKEYTFLQTVKGVPKVRDQKYIQEQIPVGVKLKDILTKIYSIEELDSKISSDFENLKDLRDRITHLKEIDKISSSLNDSDIWKILCDRSFPNYALIVKNIIGYFLCNLDEKKVPRWFKKIVF